MVDVIKIASYISLRYNRDFGEPIDEMKLHKLLYFAQRESLVIMDEPLFAAAFHAWRFGPVIVEIRALYKSGQLSQSLTEVELNFCREVMDKVFEEYAPKDSWSLSSISHGELSWQNAREGVSPYENSDRLMKLEDIREDAARIKYRRFVLNKMQKLSSNA